MSDKSEACPQCGTPTELAEETIVDNELPSDDSQHKTPESNPTVNDNPTVVDITDSSTKKKRTIPIICGSLCLLILLAVGGWFIFGSSNTQHQYVVDFEYLFGRTRDKIIFEFDKDGSLISPRTTLVQEFVNEKLKCYTYDMHIEVEPEGGASNAFEYAYETFAFNNNNQLVAYHYDGGEYDTFIIKYKGNRPKYSIESYPFDYEKHIYDGQNVLRKYTSDDDWYSLVGEFQNAYINYAGAFMQLLPIYVYPKSDNIWLRSSADRFADNKKKLIEYGTRIEVLSTTTNEYNEKWYYVRSGGYIYADAVWSEKDYIRFDSMFGNFLSDLPEIKYREGLLEWLKHKHMVGKSIYDYGSIIEKYFDNNTIEMSPTCSGVTVDSVEGNADYSHITMTLYFEGMLPQKIGFNTDGGKFDYFTEW